jgi:hypothetical protein
MNEGLPYTNVDWLGVGDPLCIKYADYDHETDYYEFTLFVYVRVDPGTGIDGGDFDFVEMFTWTWEDDFETGADDDPATGYDIGGDGVAEFVVGGCVYDPTDFQLPPYMLVPAQAEVQVYSGIDNTTGAYFGLEFPGLGAGYDIVGDKVYAAWCGDSENNMNDYNYIAELHTSFEPVSNMPASHLTDDCLNALNYLINHYNANGIMTPEFGPYGTTANTNIQESLWGVIHYDYDAMAPVYAPGTSLATSMMTAAVYAPAGYTPYPGGYGAIFAFNTGLEPRTTYVSQLVLILIDP